MENYSRTAMLIPFTEYQKKVAEGKKQSDKDLALNPDKFKGVKPGAIIGQIYPDLYSQAAYINKDIDELKTKITESVKNLFSSMGEDNIKMEIDSMSDYLTNFFQDLDEDDNRHSRKTLISVHGDVYAQGIIAKILFDIYLSNRHINKLLALKELTQQNILL